MKTRNRTMTIIIGENMDSDYDEMFSGKVSAAQPKNMLYLDSYEQLGKLLSPAKMDLLRCLIESNSKSESKTISEVASSLGRHQEAISRDASHLKNLGFVTLKRAGQAVYATSNYSRIDIRIC